MTPLSAIVEATATCSGIPRDVLVSKTRIGPVSRARNCGFVAANRMNFPQPAIGRAFNRDHSTVRHGINITAERDDPDDEDLVQCIIALAISIEAHMRASQKEARFEGINQHAIGDQNGF